jgi:hypothetical protein
MNVQLSVEEGAFVWGLSKFGKFTVKSMNLDLINDHIVFLWKYIWK